MLNQKNHIMEAIKISPEFKVILKAVSIISWSLFIFIANAQNWIIEAYLISIVIGIVCYMVFDNKRTKKSGGIIHRNRSTNRGPQREKYLNVFFVEPA
jgi:hypothetical protein